MLFRMDGFVKVYCGKTVHKIFLIFIEIVQTIILLHGCLSKKAFYICYLLRIYCVYASGDLIGRQRPFSQMLYASIPWRMQDTQNCVSGKEVVFHAQDHVS